MALSGSYDFAMNVKKIVDAAATDVGAKARGVELAGDEFNEIMDRLNVMVQGWSSFNIFLWAVAEYSVNTVASQATIELDAKVIYVPKAFIRISDTDHYVEMVDFMDYQNITEKTTEGRPLVMAVDSQKIGSTASTGMNAYMHPVSDQIYDLRYMGIRKLNDFDNSGNDIDFPVRWTKALISGLTADIAEGYGLPHTDIVRLVTVAERELAKAKAGNKELSAPTYIRSAY